MVLYWCTKHQRRREWLKVGGQEVAFSDSQLKMSYTADYGSSKNSMLLLNLPKMIIYGQKFCIFGKKFSDRLELQRRVSIILVRCCHDDATENELWMFARRVCGVSRCGRSWLWSGLGRSKDGDETGRCCSIIRMKCKHMITLISINTIKYSANDRTSKSKILHILACLDVCCVDIVPCWYSHGCLGSWFDV